MSSLFYRQPRLTALIAMVLVAAGLSAFLSIGRQEDPTITNLFATVVTPYPGADPARVEALITEKIEAELREIAEIDNIDSTSATGVSTISIELSQFISDARIEQVWSEIRGATAGVPEPEFSNDRTGAFSAISALMPRHDAVPPAVLARHAQMLEDRLRGLPGVSLVESFGVPEEEVIVAIDPVRLAALGLSAQQVASAVAAADPKVSAGRLRGARTDFLIEVTGEIRTLDRVREIPLTTSSDGFAVRLGDVATVEKAAKDPASSIAKVDGREAVLIAVKMEEGRRVDTWMERIRSELERFEATLPGGLEHRLIFDQSGYTADRLAEVAGNMGVGIALVVGVLLLTLGFRAALVVAVALPLVGLASLATLNFMAIPIHQMSVTG
ncbi:MAG: efflux RND transporter permease subunit, partial [Pseudomonadota bacterium]